MQNKTPKITIVTITYNLIKAGRENTFRQCVESVHNQTYDNIEHIVIDGASTDGSLDLIEEYANKGWIKYISEPDTGIYDAMNKGLKLATGEYIAFLNSDDFYHDMRGIQHIVKTLVSNNVDFTYAQCRYLKEDDTYYGMLYPIIGSFFVRMPCSHQSLFVNTGLMRKLGGFDSSFKSAGDYDFVIRLCLSGAKCCECHYNFVSYRLGGLSDKQQQQSVNECKKSFVKNYKRLCSQLDIDRMFDKFVVNVDLYEKMLDCVSEDIKKQMKTVWESGEVLSDKLVKITHFPSICAVTNMRLFDKIPLVKIEKYYDCTKYLLFGVLPLFKTDLYKRLFLFNVFPFIKWKHNDIYLFGLPIISQTDIQDHKYNLITSGIYNFSDVLPFETNGLSDIEPWGRWSDGDKTSFFVKTYDEYTAEFELDPFLLKGKEKQIVTVYVNGHKKGRYVFKMGKQHPKIVIGLPKSDKIHIMFKYNDVKSPFDLGVSEDSRKIAMGFKTVKITTGKYKSPTKITRILNNYRNRKTNIFNERRFIVTQDREDIEWTNTWIEKPYDFACPRVLLIGGSGARAYRKYLQTIMEKPIDFIGTSSLWMDPNFYDIFKSFFKSGYKYSLILLELGIHNGTYNTKSCEKEKVAFEKYYENFIRYLLKRQKNLVIIATKPSRLDENLEKYNDEKNQETESRNNIQKSIASKYGLKYIDTYSYVYEKNFVYRDRGHFKDDVSSIDVAKFIYNNIFDSQNIEPGIYNFSGILPFMTEGLSVQEPWGCWSDGQKTSLFFRTDAEYVAEFDVVPFVNKLKQKQIVTVYINDNKKNKYVFEYGKDVPKIIIDLPKSDDLHIMFKYEDVKSPAELGISGDERHIAIGFNTLKIKNKQ